MERLRKMEEKRKKGLVGSTKDNPFIVKRKSPVNVRWCSECESVFEFLAKSGCDLQHDKSKYSDFFTRETFVSVNGVLWKVPALKVVTGNDVWEEVSSGDYLVDIKKKVNGLPAFKVKELLGQMGLTTDSAELPNEGKQTMLYNAIVDPKSANVDKSLILNLNLPAAEPIVDLVKKMKDERGWPPPEAGRGVAAAAMNAEESTPPEVYQDSDDEGFETANEEE
jgi:hypothetical protein